MASEFENYKSLPQHYVDKKGNFDVKGYTDVNLKSLLNMVTVRAAGGQGATTWHDAASDGKIFTHTDIDLKETADKIALINSFNEHKYKERELIAKIGSCIIDEKYLSTTNNQNGPVRSSFNLEAYRADYPDANITDQHIADALNRFTKGNYFNKEKPEFTFSGVNFVSSQTIDINASKAAVEKYAAENKEPVIVDSNIANNKYWKNSNGMTIFDAKAYKKDLAKQVSEKDIEKLRLSDPSNSFFRTPEQQAVFKSNLEMEVNVRSGEKIDISTDEGKKRFFELKKFEAAKPKPEGSIRKKGFTYNLMTHSEAVNKSIMYNISDQLGALAEYSDVIRDLERRSRPQEPKVNYNNSNVAIKTPDNKQNEITAAPDTAVEIEKVEYARSGRPLDRRFGLGTILKGVADRAMFETNTGGNVQTLLNGHVVDLEKHFGKKPVAAAVIKLDDKSNPALYKAESEILSHLNNIPGTDANYLPANIKIQEVNGNIVIALTSKPLESDLGKLIKYANNLIGKELA